MRSRVVLFDFDGTLVDHMRARPLNVEHLELLPPGRGWLLAELPKVRWYVRERAREAATAEWFLSTWDAATFRLSGVAAASFWDPARAIAPHERIALGNMGVDGRALPPEVRPGTVVGTLLPRLADELGIPAGVPIVSGVNGTPVRAG